MTPRLNRIRTLLFVCICGVLTACKIVIEVPAGGTVKTESGNYLCKQKRSCSIEVVDVFFNETFRASPFQGWAFAGWQKRERALCGGTLKDCTLSTESFGAYEALMSVLSSDEEYYLIPLFEELPRLDKDDIVTEGEVVITDGGFNIAGSMEIDAGYENNQLFANAELELEFDDNGELLSLVGFTDPPKVLSDNINVESSARAEVGLYTGRQLNRDGGFEILLQDQRQYLAFLFEVGTDLVLTDPTSSDPDDSITIGTPLGGKIVVISDPADEMVYHYGELSGTAQGYAESDQGLLPYEPLIDNPALDRFNGHSYETGKFSVDAKVFSFLTLDGQLIIRQPRFKDIDITNPFESKINYAAGFNGDVDLAFAIVGFELFSFDLAQASASFNISKKRQALSIFGAIGRNDPWLPTWIPILPNSMIEADFTARGNGQLRANLVGTYRSVLPPATLEGAVRFDNDSVTMSALIPSADNRGVEITFKNQETHAIVNIDLEFADQVRESVDGALDRMEQNVRAQQDALLDAIGDYELELSLNGFREQIPGIVDAIIPVLQGVPGQTYSSVQSEVKRGINDNNVCVLGVCAVSNGTRDRAARNAASSARSQVTSRLAPYISRLENLRDSAGRADDDQVRAALKMALQEVYDNRQINFSVSVRVSVTGYSKTVRRTINQSVLTSSQSGKMLEAINNIDRIPVAGELVITRQDIVDNLPTEQVLSTVRDEVRSGIAIIPDVSGVTYSVIRGEYSGGILLSNGREYRVDFNVLNPVEAIAGMADLLAEILVE
ncbi:MAG: hypothetical protein AB8B81_08610 [Halioglobus sp.]